MPPRPIATDEAEDAGELLARAFADDPGTVMVEPDANRRSAVNAGLFAIDLRVAIEHAWVVVDEAGMAGVGVWLPPGGTDEGLDGSMVREAVAVAGDSATQRWLAMLDDLDRIRHEVMPEPHWFLALLGVDPRAQGRGVGSALLQIGHSAADRTGAPCFLETFTSHNVAFYRRRGYELRSAKCIADGVWVHAMARPGQSGQ